MPQAVERYVLQTSTFESCLEVAPYVGRVERLLAIVREQKHVRQRFAVTPIELLQMHAKNRKHRHGPP